MSSSELIKNINSVENYIKNCGIDYEIVGAYSTVVKMAAQEKDENLLKITHRAKTILEKFVYDTMGGITMWDIEKKFFAQGVKVEILEKWYDILLIEAQNKHVDSYFRYLERKRVPNERFYEPRRKQLVEIGIVSALQGMIDDKYDILCVSLPPGTGKAQPLYSKVLTPNGFVNMGDIKVGSKVISGTGKVCKVLGVYPQGKKPIYELTLDDGSKCRCSDEHLWTVQNRCDRAYETRTGIHRTRTIELKEMLVDYKTNELSYNYSLEKYNPKGANNMYFITDITYIGEEECQCIYIDDESHLYITDDYIITHNTTIEKLFNSAVIGWFPKDFTLFYSHSGDITRMYYDGVYDIVTNPDEYTWGDIFPSLQVTSTNAKLEQFNIGKYKPFPSLQCTSVGSKNAGKVRASKFLLVDDMIGGIEEALNKATLEKLWNKYAVDARQRKVQDTDGKPCKEIHIATRWSTVDVIGRLQNMYADNPRVKTIAVPDIDPVTGESNFEYEYGGFTKEFFADQELLMDDISYKCLYKQQPIEREGLLYHEDELRRYMSLPIREPDAILGICDVKNKGTDFMFLPCMYKYDDDYYLVDCVCDDSADYGIQYGRLTNIIIEHNMQQCEFESNNGGDRVSYEVNKRVEALGGRCNITEKATETNKETRIIVNADWVKKHILFKDKSLYKAKSDYGIMMEWLLRYSLVGKNTHDDVPDGLANFALYVNPRYEKRETKIIQGYL
jgi:predicted phage terminase large subunit-like protein